jgi:hypothetical protein
LNHGLEKMKVNSPITTVTNLIEKLPGNQGLFRLDFDETIGPGQWLHGDGINYPVYQYANHQAQIIAPLAHKFPEQYLLKGQSLDIANEHRKILLLAENNSIASLLFLMNRLKEQWGLKILRQRISQILVGTRTDFPFQPVPSRFMIKTMPVDTIASAQLFEDLGLPARLASETGAAGCFDGSLCSLLEQLDDGFIEPETLVVAFGTNELLATIKKLLEGKTNKQFLINPE